ncbi:MAG: hypothetical protein LQ348_002371 [Seirophora lacunosa]|nr:MAG: hypothetical protein LQ348_002371 [Seirophora lacunosa]
MAARAITYIWKYPRPTDQSRALKLMAAAYQTAVATDPNTTSIMIRSDVHSSTKVLGQWSKDEPHLTISFKNRIQEEEKTHETSHGYTKSLDDYTLVRSAPSNYIKRDDIKDVQGRDIWPGGLESETLMHGAG